MVTAQRKRVQILKELIVSSDKEGAWYKQNMLALWDNNPTMLTILNTL